MADMGLRKIILECNTNKIIVVFSTAKQQHIDQIIIIINV
jgi:hypothetical protein